MRGKILEAAKKIDAELAAAGKDKKSERAGELRAMQVRGAIAQFFFFPPSESLTLPRSVAALARRPDALHRRRGAAPACRGIDIRTPQPFWRSCTEPSRRTCCSATRSCWAAPSAARRSRIP